MLTKPMCTRDFIYCRKKPRRHLLCFATSPGTACANKETGALRSNLTVRPWDASLAIYGHSFLAYIARPSYFVVVQVTTCRQRHSRKWFASVRRLVGEKLPVPGIMFFLTTRKNF